MHDVAAVGAEVADRMAALDESLRRPDSLQDMGPHPGHDPHRDGDVGDVGDLEAGLGVGRVGMAHHVGEDVHRPAAHRPVGQLRHHRPGLVRGHPVVVGAGLVFFGVADEGQLLGPGDVGRVAVVKIGVGPVRLVEGGENGLRPDFFLAEADLDQTMGLRFGPVAPVDPLGLVDPFLFLNPSLDRSGHVPPRQERGNKISRARPRSQNEILRRASKPESGFEEASSGPLAEREGGGVLFMTGGGIVGPEDGRGRRPARKAGFSMKRPGSASGRGSFAVIRGPGRPPPCSGGPSCRTRERTRRPA